MVNGNLSRVQAPQYEDYPSLKKWIRSQYGIQFKRNVKLINFVGNQAGTASLVDISEKGGETIVQIAAEGAVYAKCEADDASTQSKEATLEYLDGDGDEHVGYAVFGVDSSVEAQFMTTSGGAVPVADFKEVQTLTFENTVEGGYLAIGPTGFASIYGIIEQNAHWSNHSRYVCPKGKSAWLGRLVHNTSYATRIVQQVDMTFTPYGHTDPHTIPINNNGHLSIDPTFRIAANTALTFRIIGNSTQNTFNIHILEVEDV